MGAGTEYGNEVARAVLSERAATTSLPKCRKSLLERSAAGSRTGWSRPRDALALMAEMQAFVEEVLSGTQPVRAASLYALYAGGSLRSRREMFVLDQKAGETPFSHGRWQPDTLPRFLKLRLDCGGPARAARRSA